MAKSKNVIFALLLAAVCVSKAFSVSVAAQVVQHDATHDEVRAISLLVEECFMDFFFERGYVITNSPAEITSTGSEDKAVFHTGMHDASEGRCDYFVQLIIDYKSNTNSPEAMLLSNIKSVQWKIYSVDSEQLLKSGKNSVGSIMQNQDSEAGIRSFTEDIANHVYEYLLDR